MTRRTGPLGVGFEPESPAARTTASTHVMGAPPTELNSATMRGNLKEP